MSKTLENQTLLEWMKTDPLGKELLDRINMVQTKWDQEKEGNGGSDCE